MKNKIKHLLITSLVLFCINYLNHKTEKPLFDLVSPAEQKVDTYTVCATMYYPVSSQCDSDPLLTAGMYHIKPNHASEQKWIAMSRDMLKRWGGDFDYGDVVKIEGAGHKDGIYKVVDTMNKRFKNRIDFLEDKGTKHYKFDNVKITKWTLQEKSLATL